MRPCATDFSIAAIMSRHGRARAKCKEREAAADTISPLGKLAANLIPTISFTANCAHFNNRSQTTTTTTTLTTIIDF